MSKPILIKDWSIVTPRESSTIGYTLIFNFISSTQVKIKLPETMGEYCIVGTVNNIPISTGRIRVIRRYKKPGRILIQRIDSLSKPRRKKDITSK